MAERFVKIAVLYLALGVTLGVVMGMLHVFTFMPVHAHLNLLGWASLALVGLVYHAYPQAAQTRLATVHFWLHNVGLPPLMISLALMLAGHAAFEPVVGLSSLVVAAGVLVFVVNVWRTLPASSASPARVAVAAR
jgi:cbb3-type cytochrome oxidase subunit 1